MLKEYPQQSVIKVKNNDCKACIYDSVWWVGSIMEIDKLLSEVKVKWNFFQWPSREDMLWMTLQQSLS